MGRLGTGYRVLLAAGLLGIAGGLLPAGRLGSPAGAGHAAYAQEQAPGRRDVHVTARRYEYSPPRIEVTQDDLVKITLASGDIPHSFTIDEYRIAKRVGAGQTVTFEFRADQPGTFAIYCNLRQDEKCREMRGTLVVRPR